MTDMQYLRSKWGRVHCCRNFAYQWSVLDFKPPGTRVLSSACSTRKQAIAQAVEFTRTREREIAEMKRNYDWAMDARVIGDVTSYDMDAKRRTLKLIESALAELRRGWKGE